MSVLSWTSALAITTAGFALLGGTVATELTTYGAVSNEAAGIYAYQTAMLDASGSYTSDLDSIPTSAANDHTIIASVDSYALVTQIPTGEIYLSTSMNPNPIQVDAENAEVVALPAGVDGEAITSAIAGYEDQFISDESEFDRTKREVVVAVGEWLGHHAPPKIFSS